MPMMENFLNYPIFKRLGLGPEEYMYVQSSLKISEMSLKCQNLWISSNIIGSFSNIQPVAGLKSCTCDS